MQKIEQFKEYSASEARNRFSDVFDQAHYGKPVIVKKHSRKVAIVPLELLDRLSELEALIDTQQAESALEEFNKMGGRNMEDVLSELDIE